MNKLIKSMLTSLLLLTSLGGYANELADAKKAVKLLQQQSDVEFAYQRLSEFGDSTMTERYRPLPDSHGWTLVTENGEKPSSQRLVEYQQMKHDEWQSAKEPQEGEEQQSVKLSLSDMIQTETLAYAGTQKWQEQTVRAYTFTPYLDKFSEHEDKLQGYLYLAPESTTLKGVSIRLKESFSPAMSVSLDDFEMVIELMPIERGERTFFVPRRTEEQVAGSYLFFKDFGNHTVRTYTDYSVLDAASVSRVSAN